MDFEKKAFKDQTDEIKKLETVLREKMDAVEDLELQNLNLKQKMMQEESHYKSEIEQYKRKINDYHQQQEDYYVKYDRLEEKYIERDEMLKKYEEEN